MEISLGVVPKLEVGERGSFEVEVDGQVVFSKLRENRFPNPGELIGLISSLGGGGEENEAEEVP